MHYERVKVEIDEPETARYDNVVNRYFLRDEVSYRRMCFKGLLQSFARCQPGVLFDTGAHVIDINC